MLALFFKELNYFFSSLTGYLVIGVYIIINSLFLFVFPGEMNIPDGGHATLEPYFFLAPWVFLFLVPAITMRMFAEESKSGTLEHLYTRPLSEMQIVLAKFFAAVILVLLAIIPTLIFYFSVYLLGDPVGNIDTGATIGSFLGLFFLASVYAAIGVFASTLTDNQVVAFILAVGLCFFIFMGFEFISNLSFLTAIAQNIRNMGVNEHFRSMARGVFEIRDLIYFMSIAAIFVFLTRSIIQSRNWK